MSCFQHSSTWQKKEIVVRTNDLNHSLSVMMRTVLIGSMLLLSSLLAWADDAGDALARRIFDRPDGKDASSLVTMALIEKGKPPRMRQMVSYRLDKKAGEVASLIRFIAPADIDGTGLLTLDFPNKEAEQWIYLPALQRVRRIASDRKAGRFVNSDYYYEDLRSRSVEKDRHHIIGRAKVAGVDCEILESTPVDAANSVYLKRQAWLDLDTLLPMRIDFFEKDPNQPSKRWWQLKKAQINGFWTVMDSTLVDLGSGHQTRLIVQKIAYDRNLPENVFSTRALEDKSVEEKHRP
jgi:hypothetical protein